MKFQLPKLIDKINLQQSKQSTVSQNTTAFAVSSPSKVNISRRDMLRGFVAGSGLVALNTAGAVQAETMAEPTTETDPVPEESEEDLHFPGDPAAHKLVYQFNKSDEKYHNAVLFSVGAMLRKYGDNIHIVVVGIGPGIHIMAKKPGRPVKEIIRQRVASLLQYGVEFHACGNTMKALGWKDDNILNSAKIVEVGAADLMELQEQGYSYISW